MSRSDATDPIDRHRIPAIDRAMEVLGLLERRAAGASIRDLVAALALPRTSVYRILNSLETHGMVRRAGESAYALGPRLLSLAARVAAEGQRYDIAAIAAPHLERLSQATGEACKVSALDGDGVLVLAAMQGNREFALSVTPGQKLPLHAGAASKALMASLDDDDLERALATPLIAYTSRTFADPRRLRAELAKIRRQGWAADKGEYQQSVHAFAAPIHDSHGHVVAALSAPYLAGSEGGRLEQIRLAVIAAAAAIGADIPASG
ncbi:IclR family transcriptional regulator [Terrarubrum flagellatum]|uniref:IclR family transcriptional regulator n=1 Tax=Terrirubrum flagellatum TaxID=2895980 RepID=UPI00314563CC